MSYYPLVAAVLGLLFAFTLPYWVYDVHRRFGEFGTFAFWRAVIDMGASAVALECALRLFRRVWDEETGLLPSGKPLPKPDPVVLLERAALLLTQVVALMMFLTTMDGGLRWAAARWVYPAYAVPALGLLAARWKRWTWPERLYLRWGWAPVLAFGVPVALPRLLAAGLIRGPLE
jgi:hypothetical protein